MRSHVRSRSRRGDPLLRIVERFDCVASPDWSMTLEKKQLGPFPIQMTGTRLTMDQCGAAI